MKALPHSLVIFITLFLMGCTNIYLGTENDKYLDEIYIGVVKVSTPEGQGKNHSINLDVESIGAWLLLDGRQINDSMWGGGIGLGYKNIKTIKAAANCQITIVVYTKSELQEFMDILKQNGIDGENVCAFQKPP